MFKSARSRLRAAVFACAAALGLGAYAATPIAVWDGNFSESATINGATFNANGNTVAEDGSYVKITGEKGAVFTLNKSYRYITAVFTVSNLNETAAYDRALAVVGGGTLFGAYLQSGTLTTHGINGNAIWPSTLTDSAYDATLTSYADASTKRTFSLTQAHSSNSQNGTHLYEVYGGDTAAAIKFGGNGNNGLRAGQAYSKVVIGGMESYTEGTTLFKAASDLVILKVALYASDSTFPIAQADYATYSMPSMTVVTTPSTMSALNTAVAASSDAVALSDVSATITLDAEPSDATKSILQSAYWQGTVLIKDADKNDIVPSNYGNPNSTLKLSGVKGYFAAQQFNSSATPAIELEDSETDGREYGLWQNNGYSFYSGASATYQYMNTPELKGSGTYKIDTAETSSLFVADKFSSFTGKLEVTYGAVWLGVAVPSRDAAGRELVKVGTVRVSEAFVNAPLSQWTGWTVANGYLGDITVAAGSTNNYTDNRVNFLKADSWKGTVTISTATNNTNGHVEIWLSKLGGANSKIVINDLVSGSKDYYLNEGNYQNNPTFVSTIDINGDVQFKNGSSGQTVTFDKVTSDSATDKLTFAFPTSATLNFKINSLDNFAGTISASSSTPLTISNITSTAALGTALVKVDATNKNIASLDATELNGTSTNLCVDTVNDVSGIYIAAAIIGSTGYATVQNAIDALGSDPTDAQLATVSVADANAAIPEGYKSENGVIARDIVYVAQIKTGATTYEKYTTLADALDSENIAYGITLLADVTESDITVDSNVNISGSYAINANITVANGAQLKLMFVTLNGRLTIQTGGTYMTNGGTLGEVVVQDGGIINLTTLSADAAPLTVSTLTVNGALTIVSTYSGAVRGTTYKAISYATEAATIAEGASFNGKDEWTASTVVDGDNTVVCLAITKVAVVDGVYYDTAQEAVEAAVASGKQAEFLVQPGTVTLGAGETLVVKGAYQPTVELDAGLSSAQYAVESDYDLDELVYTYAVKSYVAQIGDTKYESVADAVAAATSGQTVTLLADVTLTDKLVVSNKTVTITADSAKTITGQLRVVDGSNVTIGENVTITSDKHPTVFVLGDPAVKTAGTAKSTLVVNGIVLNTNAGFDQTFAIAGNGLDTKGVDITINGTVRNANGIAIYQAFPGNLVVNGTVEGASAISIKDGTLTVNSGAVVRATLASGAAYVGNNNGDSPTGDAIIAPYYDLSRGYGTPVVSIAGGEITVTDTENCTGIEAYDFEGATAPNDSASNVNVSGGTFNTAVADTYCANGYEPKDNGNGTYGVRVDKGWIYEDADFPNYTGSWNKEISYDETTHKAAIEDGATYTAAKASDGQFVTVAMTLSFDDVNDDDSDFGDAKAAIRLAAGETDGTYQFQLYTSDGENKVWTNATVEIEATKEVDYNFVFVLDLTNKIYTASVVSGTTTNALTIGENVMEIPFACQGEVTPVQTIDFVGSGTVSSIKGGYETPEPPPAGFVEDEEVTLDGGKATLTEAQAEWLNACGDKAAVNAKIATMTADAFNNAYLLNLNILNENYQDYEEGDFVVTDFRFDTKQDGEYVVVEVSLERNDAELDGGINGTLKLKGASQLGVGFEVKETYNLKFDGCDTETIEYKKDGTTLFYKPVIE